MFFKSITAVFPQIAAIFYALEHTNWNGFLLRTKIHVCIQLIEAQHFLITLNEVFTQQFLHAQLVTPSITAYRL